MKFGVCIDTLYTELNWYDRFAAAKADGFDAVEFWDWRIHDLEKTAECAKKVGILISGFNGDSDYSLVDPTHMEAYMADLEKSLEAAKILGAPSVTIHSNALGQGGVVVNHYNELSDTVKLCSMFRTLSAATALAGKHDIQLNLEGLNVHTDHEGNFLRETRMAAEIVRLIAHPKLKILYDVYHMQINEGSICDNILSYGDTFGHVHIADVPGRHEPGTGEINYVKVLKCLNSNGYTGIVGCELFPRENTAEAVRAIMEVKAAVECD